MIEGNDFFAKAILGFIRKHRKRTPPKTLYPQVGVDPLFHFFQQVNHIIQYIHIRCMTHMTLDVYGIFFGIESHGSLSLRSPRLEAFSDVSTNLAQLTEHVGALETSVLKVEAVYLRVV